jgi:hypothetical protein
MPLVIQFVGPEGNVVEEQTTRIPPGGLIEASMTTLPEVVRLLVNGSLCEGTLMVESDRRTRVILRVSDTGCSVETKGFEPY